MDRVNVAVIGCGYWGPNLIRNYIAIPEANLSIVADLRQERLDHIQRLYPQVRVTRNYQDIFNEDIDAVAIATPPATHFPIGIDCLLHGLHTFVEKPITLNSRDAIEMIRTAEERDRVLMVGHTFEYNAAVRKIKEIIQSGELGEIYYVNAERLNLGLFQSDMNVLWDLAPHDLSILLYLLDESPLRVSAQGGDCIFRGKHDIAFMNLEFPSRVLAHIHVSWLDPCKVRRITVVGSQKMLVFDDIESLEKIRIYDKGVDHPPYSDSFCEFQCSYRYGDVIIPHIRWSEPLQTETKHFIDCIRNNGEKPLSCGHDGLRIVQILEAAEHSLINGGVSQPIHSKIIMKEKLPIAA